MPANYLQINPKCCVSNITFDRHRLVGCCGVTVFVWLSLGGEVSMTGWRWFRLQRKIKWNKTSYQGAADQTFSSHRLWSNCLLIGFPFLIQQKPLPCFISVHTHTQIYIYKNTDFLQCRRTMKTLKPETESSVALTLPLHGSGLSNKQVVDI